jgi:hypothetical protein
VEGTGEYFAVLPTVLSMPAPDHDWLNQLSRSCSLPAAHFRFYSKWKADASRGWKGRAVKTFAGLLDKASYRMAQITLSWLGVCSWGAGTSWAIWWGMLEAVGSEQVLLLHSESYPTHVVSSGHHYCWAQSRGRLRLSVGQTWPRALGWWPGRGRYQAPGRRWERWKTLCSTLRGRRLVQRHQWRWWWHPVSPAMLLAVWINNHHTHEY